MAMVVEDVFDLITEKSLEIPISTPIGLNRVNSIIRNRLKKKPIEDNYSIIKSVDFERNRIDINEKGVFDIGSTYIDALLKLRLDGFKINDINKTIRNTLNRSRLDLVSLEGVAGRNKEYVIPIRKLSDSYDRAYLVLNYFKDTLKLPKFNGYEAPIVSFNYSNKKTGKLIVEDLYASLCKLSEQIKTSETK